MALRFLMLTVARTSEICLATFGEVDGNVWTLDAKRAKIGKEHRVPLSVEALAVVELARAQSLNELLFPAQRGKPLSDAAMSRFMEREDYDARPQGFRATFRTWVEETTETSFEFKESALGHQVDGETVRAYQRSDRLEKRAQLRYRTAALWQSDHAILP